MTKVMRAVVGHEERPYDRDVGGREITHRWDVLECGHVLPSRFVKGRGRQVMAANAGGDYYENYQQRDCKKCGEAT